MKISINKNQNQMKKTVETQTECETDGESDNEFDALTSKRMLKRKIAKINYS